MISGKSILVVVPARGGSKGIKLKNIQSVGGIPLVARVGQVVTQLDWVDRAVVSTDHQRIATIAKQCNLDVPFLRPKEISGDIVADWDVLKHALLYMEKTDDKRYDITVMLQPTCPLRKPEHVTKCVNKLIAGGYDSVWTISETDSKNHPLKQLTFFDEKLDYYNQKGAKIIARQQLDKVYHRNGAAYAISRDCILNKKSIKGNHTSAVIIEDPLISIDSQFDIDLCEFLLR